MQQLSPQVKSSKNVAKKQLRVRVSSRALRIRNQPALVCALRVGETSPRCDPRERSECGSVLARFVEFVSRYTPLFLAHSLRMHSLVRRYIKTAVAFLAVGLGIGVWMLVRRELYDTYATPFETSAHTHALLVGFVMEMILGVALWLFPRPEKTDTRYKPQIAEAAYWLLTIGTAARVAGELARPFVATLSLRWFIVLCGLAQTAGLLLFFSTMWRRIRPLGSAARERAGERF